jgi:membrane-bound serine protease (ClpP class)
MRYTLVMARSAHVAASLFACAIALAATAPPAYAARDGPQYAQTVSWLRENYPRDAAPDHPESIVIAGCDVAVTRRPDRKTDVTTHVTMRDAQVTYYSGPGSPHVDFLTAGIFPMRFRFADGSTSTSGTAAAVLGTRRGDQAVRVASAFSRLHAWCARAGHRTRTARRAAAPAARTPRGIAPVVDVIRIDGIIGPGAARYVVRALGQAEREPAQALLVVLDTPGGLLRSTDDITRAMLNAPVPVVVYVYPRGARAASAGVFVTYAANVAAMAPATHLGAAHPVGLGAGGAVDKTEMTKLTNDAVAQIRSIAAQRGRNAAWAERAVRQSESITAEQALRLHVVDLIAANPDELLARIDGRTVRTAAGPRRLATRGARLAEIPPDATERFLTLLSDPNVGFILMTIAIYGIIFELSNPGAVFPGVLGGLALVLAFASFAVIAVNVAGLLLIAFALILFVADIKVPSHGVLTSGGIAAFVLGSLLLTERNAPFLRISLTLILSVAAVTAAFFLFAIGAGIRAQRRRVVTGREGLLGALGVTRSELSPSGTVFLQGELWRAETDAGTIPVGQSVRVAGVDGLRLHVHRAENVPQEKTT